MHAVLCSTSACDRLSCALPSVQALFPGEFDQLVRVCNHKNVDKLLTKHDGTTSHRDVLLTRADKARRALLLARAEEAMAAKPSKAKAVEHADLAVEGGGPSVQKAVAKLQALQAEIAVMDLKVEELEEEIEKAQEDALSKPLGTAFFVLFK